MFGPVDQLKLNCNILGQNQDVLNPEQLAKIKHLTIGKNPNDSDKAYRIIRQLAPAAPNLEYIDVDFVSTAPKMALEMILGERPSLKVLKARSITTEIAGISYMNIFAQVTNL